MLVYSAVGIAVLVVLGAVLVRAQRSRARDAENRLSRARFVTQFAAHGVPADLLGHTYDELRQRHPQGPADLPLDARLQQDCGLSRLDLEDAALVIVTRAGRSVPRAADLDRLDQQVATVGDLVDFVAAFGRVEVAGR